jgi:hypothetical protein
MSAASNATFRSTKDPPIPSLLMVALWSRRCGERRRVCRELLQRLKCDWIAF